MYIHYVHTCKHTIQYNTTQHNTTQHTKIQYNKMQIQYNAIQSTIIKYNYIAIQIQYNTYNRSTHTYNHAWIHSYIHTYTTIHYRHTLHIIHTHTLHYIIVLPTTSHHIASHGHVRKSPSLADGRGPAHPNRRSVPPTHRAFQSTSPKQSTRGTHSCTQGRAFWGTIGTQERAPHPAEAWAIIGTQDRVL